MDCWTVDCDLKGPSLHWLCFVPEICGFTERLVQYTTASLSVCFLGGKARNTVFSAHLLPLVSDTIELAALLLVSTIIPLYLEMLISCNAQRAHPASHHQSALFMSGNLSAPDACQHRHPSAQLQLPCEKCLLLFSSKYETAGRLKHKT